MKPQTENIGWTLYFWRLFIRLVCSTYFREITVDGLNNIPTNGAIIFVGNHQNQFIDPMLLCAFSPRFLGFLIAAKSMSGTVGFFARVFRAIPVTRPQDSAKEGPGTIVIDEASTTILGTQTTFTKHFRAGEHQIAVKGQDPFRIVKVVSDTEIHISSPPKKSIQNSTYKILERMDQTGVYKSVWSRLGAGECVGIFPEGGSHDRSQLLPLKAGVCIMALGAMVESGKPVNIVPCGLNYFSGHRFRGHALLEFGRPYLIPMELADEYKKNPRQACDTLLQTIKQHMDTVITQAPDHETLLTIKLTRKLYQPTNIKLEPEKYLALHNRFLKGWSMHKDHPSVIDFTTRLREYSSDLENLGLQDGHIDADEGESLSTGILVLLMLWRFFLCFLTLILAFPGCLMYLPVGLAARFGAQKYQKEALKSSEVKIEAKDVLGSNKVIIALAGIPLLSSFYFLLFSYLYGMNKGLLFLASIPIWSSITVRFAEEGFALVKSLHAMWIMKFKYSERIQDLKDTRVNLQKQVRGIVAALGQSLAGKEDLEDWRIIKESDLRKSDSDKKASPAKILSVKAQKPFLTPTKKKQIVVPIISDSEWDDLKDIWN